MSFKIEITEIFNPQDGQGPILEVERFSLTVDHQIDLQAVFAAINTPPKQPRVRNRKKVKE